MSTTTRVSIANDGTQGNDWSYSPAISNNGNYVAFESYATNLVTSDTNALPDIFWHDVESGITSRVSVASDGTQGNDSSYNPAISGNGQYVVFESYANNLVENDTNNTQDIFVHNLETGTTDRVNIGSNGAQANGYSYVPQINGDGRYITFASSANNLVEGDTNNAGDVFVHDRNTGITTRVSIATNGSQGNKSSDNPVISDDGRYIAFTSGASNLVEGDTNNSQDVFVHDRNTGITTRVSVASDGSQASDWSYSPAISGNGRYVTFASYADDLTGPSDGDSAIFVHDLETGNTKEISGYYAWYYTSTNPVISDDGRYVMYELELINTNEEVNEIFGIYLYDSQTDETTPIISSNNRTQSGYYPAISGDGKYLTFGSYASDLVPGDTNNAFDVFVVDQGVDEFNYSLIVNPTSIIEGNSGTHTVTYNLTRTGNVSNSSQIDYSISGTATNGQDYNSVPLFGTLSFAPDEVSKSLTFEVIGDTETEPDETIIVSLSDGTSVTTTILNDDFTLNGTSGNDTLIGGEEAETINGLDGHDSLKGNGSNDTLNGGNGNDLLDGGTGNDYLEGGNGNDTYILDSLEDKIYEASASGGTDKVVTSFSYTLGTNLENLTLNNGGNWNGKGNSLNNRIIGNSSRNILNGAAGNDTLIGGLGHDTLIGGTGRDRFRFNSHKEGIDKIQDFNIIDDKIEVVAKNFRLSHGILKSSQFVIGTGAIDSNDRFVYNPNTGDLFFDADGKGAMGSVKLATLGNFLNLTNNHIVAI